MFLFIYIFQLPSTTSSSSYKSLPEAKLNRELTDFIITIFGRALGNIAIKIPIMNVRTARTIHTERKNRQRPEFEIHESWVSYFFYLEI